MVSDAAEDRITLVSDFASAIMTNRTKWQVTLRTVEIQKIYY